MFVMRICGVLLTAMTAYGQMPGYGGPGVSSRGGKMAGSRGSEPVSIRPFFSVLGVTDTGLTPVILTETGDIKNPGNLYGVEASVGAYGTKAWKRTQLGLDYQGGYRHYTSKTFYDGSDHMLGLDVSQQVSRRAAFRLHSVAGTTSRTVGGTFGAGIADPTLLGTTFNDIFDNRAYFAQVSGDMVMQMGSRSSIMLGASGFAVRRQSKALVGMNGQQAFGTFSRKLNRRTDLSLVYQYMHVDYPRVFGEADVNTAMLQLGRSIGQRWNLTVGGGAFRSDFSGVRTVAVDPVVAELFGVTSARAAFNQISTSSAISTGVTRTIRRGSFGLSYSRGANPGNGALLLNRSEMLGVSFSYNTGNKWFYSVSTQVARYSGLGIYNGRQTSYGSSFLASRVLLDNVHFTGMVDYRHFSVNTNTFQRLSTRIALGLTYSPGDLPISLR